MTSDIQSPSKRSPVAPVPETPAKSGRGWRIVNLALAIVVLDQLTKLMVLRYLGFAEEKTIVEGFFKLVHWGNTGAAWSMLSGNNGLLAVVAIVALIALFFTRHHFNIHTFGGQISLGLIFGGIVGNLIDRIRIGHVVDFLYFYVIRRDGVTAGFPAFNVADSAICIGVGLLFILSWQGGPEEEPSTEGRG
jgi:signal peptidase II